MAFQNVFQSLLARSDNEGQSCGSLLQPSPVIRISERGLNCQSPCARFRRRPTRSRRGGAAAVPSRARRRARRTRGSGAAGACPPENDHRAVAGSRISVARGSVKSSVSTVRTLPVAGASTPLGHRCRAFRAEWSRPGERLRVEHGVAGPPARREQEASVGQDDRRRVADARVPGRWRYGGPPVRDRVVDRSHRRLAARDVGARVFAAFDDQAAVGKDGRRERVRRVSVRHERQLG